MPSEGKFEDSNILMIYYQRVRFVNCAGSHGHPVRASTCAFLFHLPPDPSQRRRPPSHPASSLDGDPCLHRCELRQRNLLTSLQMRVGHCWTEFALMKSGLSVVWVDESSREGLADIRHGTLPSGQCHSLQRVNYFEHGAVFLVSTEHQPFREPIQSPCGPASVQVVLGCRRVLCKPPRQLSSLRDT